MADLVINMIVKVYLMINFKSNPFIISSLAMQAALLLVRQKVGKIFLTTAVS